MFSLYIYYVHYIIIVPNLRDFHFQMLLSPEKTVSLHRCTAREGRQGCCLHLTRVNPGPQGCVTPVTSERERAGTALWSLLMLCEVPQVHGAFTLSTPLAQSHDLNRK